MPMLKKTITLGTLFTLCVVLLTIFYQKQCDDLQEKLKNVLSGLRMIENMFHIHHPKIAVGFGACKDINFDGKLILPYRSMFDKPVHHDSINNWEQLYNSYAYYFMHGAAAERYISNTTLFNELVSDASKLTDIRVSVGGNAASIARRFLWDGCEVILGATMTSELKKMLPSGLQVVGEKTYTDDVHLVFEYKANEKWGPYIAPRANRFIVHSDVHNPMLSSLETFGKSLTFFHPQLLIISGVQMMDNYPISYDTKQLRFKKVNYYVNSVPASTKIHFEMASVTQKELLSLIFENIIPYIDSIGMNEQELDNMYSSLKGGNVTLASDSNPSAGKVLDKMRLVFKKVRNMKEAKLFYNRKLSRLHVHTLASQLIMIDKHSPWKDTAVAVAKASLIANRYVCDSSEVDIDKAALVMDESFSVSATPGSRRIFLDERNPVSCWDENSLHICIAPNLVCQKAKQTAGCGDNISATALSAQL